MSSNNTPAILRSLVIFGLCIPLAAWIGYLLAAPADRSTFGIGAILALVLLTPLLLQWHHFLLIAGWNLALTIFFLPGSPPVWMLLTALSLGLSVLRRTLNNQAHFLHAPEIARPLIFLLVVVLGTAALTGGIGLHSLGGDVSGGKHYLTLIFGIFGYFAITALRIPPSRVSLYLTLFFLLGLSRVIGDLGPLLPSSLQFLFLLFPISGYDINSNINSIDFNPRYAGVSTAALCGLLLMLSRYGARGIFLENKPLRIILFTIFALTLPLGGFRSITLLFLGIFFFQFFMEGLHRTKFMPVFLFAALIGIVLLVPFANKLPFTFQRSLAFLPLKLSQQARLDAESSSEWRLEIWRDTLPEVPKYLLLGKGFAISQSELGIAQNRNFHDISVAKKVSISGNYHSGPLSVLMPLGAWGAIGVLWLWFVGFRALYANYRFGDPLFRVSNLFLLAYFFAKVVLFVVVFGGIEEDLAFFACVIGLSVSINGGIRRPPPVPVVPRVKSRVSLMAGPPLQPVFPR